MNPDKSLQDQITDLKRRLDAFNASPSIPLAVDLAWQARGFIKTEFFVAGTGSFSAFGTYNLTIPGSTKNSIALVTGYPGNAGSVNAQMTPAYANNNYGAASSQFDITNPAGTTFRYTWDGTGTNPNINATTLPVGSHITIFSSGGSAMSVANQNSAGNPYFVTTGAGANYFEIDNPTPGVAENNKTLGSGGSLTGGPVTQNFGLFVEGTALDEFAFVVFLFPSLFITN